MVASTQGFAVRPAGSGLAAGMGWPQVCAFKAQRPLCERKRQAHVYNAVQLEIQFSDGRRANHTGLRRSHGEVLGCVLPSGAPWPADPGPGDPRVRGHPDAGGLLEAAERHNPVHDGALDEGDLDLWPGASWLYMVLGLRLA